MENAFMNCRIRTSFRLFGMPQKKNRDVTRMKGSSGEPARRERSPCAFVVGLWFKLILRAFNFFPHASASHVRCELLQTLTEGIDLVSYLPTQISSDTRIFLTFDGSSLQRRNASGT